MRRRGRGSRGNVGDLHGGRHFPHSPSRHGIYRRVALAAAAVGMVELAAGELDAAVAALSTFSLRVGLTQDLFAAGEDGSGVPLTLRWSPPSTALRYGRQLQVQSGVTARVLSRESEASSLIYSIRGIGVISVLIGATSKLTTATSSLGALAWRASRSFNDFPLAVAP